MSPKQFSMMSKVLVLIALFTLFTFSTMLFALSRVPQEFTWVDHTQRVLFALKDVLIDTQDIESGERGYLLTGKSVYLPPYNDGIKNVSTDMQMVSSLTKDNGAQVQNYKKLNALVNLRINLAEILVVMRRTLSLEQIRAKTKSNPLFNQDAPNKATNAIRAQEDVMAREEKRLLIERRLKLRREDALARGVGMASGLLLLVFLLVVYFWAQQAKRSALEMISMIQGMRRPIPPVTSSEDDENGL